jgi:hypothetical protein
MLTEMSERLLQTRTFEQAVHPILDDVIAFHGAQYGNVQLPVGEHLVIAAQRGFTTEFLERFKCVKMDDGCACGRALRFHQSIVVDDVETDVDFAMYRDDARRAGFRSVQTMPLITNDKKLLGMVSTHFATVGKPSNHKIRALHLYGINAAERAYQLLGDEELAIRAARMSENVYFDLRFPPHDAHALGTTPGAQGLFQMETSAQCRKFATECDRLAAQAKTEEHRTILREMAHAWRKVVEEVEKQKEV